MLRPVRRFLVIATLMLWQGGFTFYAAVVVPIGMDELGSHTAQGFITRRVAPFLNLAGVVALLPMIADVLWTRGDRPVRVRLRWAALIILSLTLVTLLWLYPRMDGLLDPSSRTVLEPSTFGPLHQTYLIVSTVQWAVALAYLWLTLNAWRHEDAGA